MSNIIQQPFLTDYNILLCPYCKTRIPYIQLIKWSNLTRVKMQCDCIAKDYESDIDKFLELLTTLNLQQHSQCSTDLHSHIQADKYCAVCQKWLCADCLITHNAQEPNHIITNIKLNLTCSNHKKTLDHYCIECSRSCCIDCTDHKSHHIYKLNDNSLKTFIKDSHENNLETIKQLRDTFISNTRFAFDIDHINNVYNSQMKIVSELKPLYDVILHTVAVVKDYIPYMFNQSFDSLKVRYKPKPQIDTKSKSYFKLFHKYVSHFTLLNIQNGTSYVQDMRQLSKTLIHIGTTSFRIEKAIQLKDGRLVLCACKIIQIWNPHTFQCIKQVKSKIKKVYSMIQLHDERLIFIDSLKTRMMIWDVSTFQCLQTINTVIFTPPVQLQDGRLIFRSFQSICFWDVIKQQNCASLQLSSHKATSSYIQLKDGRLVVCDIKYYIRNESLILNNEEGVITVWDVKSLKCLQEIKNYYAPIKYMFQLIDERLATCDENGFIKLWNMSTFQCVTSIYTNQRFESLPIQLSNGSIATFYFNIRLWDIKTFAETTIEEFGENMIELKDGLFLIRTAKIKHQYSCVKIKIQ